TSDAGAPLLRKSSAAQGSWGSTVGPSSKTRWLLLVQQEKETLLARRTLAIALGKEDFDDRQSLCTDPVLRATARTPSYFLTLHQTLVDFACILYLCGIVAYCILYLCGIVAYRG
ncbi:MAG: hypothetical protein ACXVBY_14635, partial [Isosphaeraceae bacterium]